MNDGFYQLLLTLNVGDRAAKLAQLLLDGTLETLYMTLVSTFFAYVLGIPLGIALTVTGKQGLRPAPVVYRGLDVTCNLLRSVPFIILLVVIIPFTRFLVGRSYGSTATIVPLVLSAAPFVGRMVESSLKEVDQGVVEAAESMGASLWQIIFKVLLPEARTSLIIGVTIAVGTILGYSAMAGAVGGGGLGDLAIQYGYHRYDTVIMMVTLVLLVLIAQLLQTAGMRMALALDRRKH
ncbi:MAG: methionine ABC transporter permease [Oligosphaeraceae bacterium]